MPSVERVPKSKRRARDAAVRAKLPLVRGVAVRYRGAGLPYEDLVQEGSIGLLEAMAQYDPARGGSFDAYARFRVHRSIRNALTERGRLVRLPKHVVERRRAVERERTRLFQATGRAAEPEELAARVGLPLEQVVEALGAEIQPVSLDASVGADGSPLEAFVSDPEAVDPESVAVEDDEREHVDAAVAELPPRQRCMIERTFGFSREPESVAAVAHDLRLSPQRARTIVGDALYKLREELSQSDS